MKRELLQNVKVQPIASGDVIHKAGFLSAVIGAVIGTAGVLTITIAHSDDGTTFETATDKLMYPTQPTAENHDGEYTADALAVDDVVNIDVDLLGLKDYIKVTASGTAATSTTLAIVLGDNGVQPV